MQKKRLGPIIQYIVFLGGGIFLVWWQLKGMSAADRAEFNNALQSANYWLLLPVAAMSLLSHLSRAMRWQLLLEPLGYKASLKNLFSVVMVGYLANAAVPRLGEVLKCTFLARYEKMKVDKLVGTIIVERTFDFFSYLVFIGITILLQYHIIGHFLQEQINAFNKGAAIPLWGKILILLSIGIALLLLARLLLKKLAHIDLVKKIQGIVQGLVQGFSSIRHLRRRKLFLAHTVFIWAMYLLQIYVGFFAIDATAHLGLPPAFSVLTLATLAMILTPGGIGAFPFFVMQTLAIYLIPLQQGKAFGWLMWGASTSIVIVVGVACLLLLPYINKKKQIDEAN
jgi:glycosyltransferase 2 family protein